MKKLLYILCAAALAAGCSDDDASSYYLDELVIDTANCLAEGSYVQGVEANDLCRIKIPYENARGGTARISAPETNGLRIDAQEVTLVSGAGEATVAVKGTPLLLETSFLQLNVEYRAKTYLSSVEIAVLEDVDPSGTIEFEIDRTPLTGLTAPETIAFTVSPTMAAVVESGTTPDGLRVNVVSDPATGEGTVTFTPAANFLGGEVELTASFGARPPQVCKIRVSAFAAGEGTADAPYEVTSAADSKRSATDSTRLSASLRILFSTITGRPPAPRRSPSRVRSTATAARSRWRSTVRRRIMSLFSPVSVRVPRSRT